VDLAAPNTWWADDVRGAGRAVRVSTHVKGGFLVLSIWKSGQCAGTVRLLPTEAAGLVAGISSGLAQLATPTVKD
jgi:hypothetical protein